MQKMKSEIDENNIEYESLPQNKPRKSKKIANILFLIMCFLLLISSFLLLFVSTEKETTNLGNLPIEISLKVDSLDEEIVKMYKTKYILQTQQDSILSRSIKTDSQEAQKYIGLLIEQEVIQKNIDSMNVKKEDILTLYFYELGKKEGEKSQKDIYKNVTRGFIYFFVIISFIMLGYIIRTLLWRKIDDLTEKNKKGIKSLIKGKGYTKIHEDVKNNNKKAEEKLEEIKKIEKEILKNPQFAKIDFYSWLFERYFEENSIGNKSEFQKAEVAKNIYTIQKIASELPEDKNVKLISSIKFVLENVNESKTEVRKKRMSSNKIVQALEEDFQTMRNRVEEEGKLTKEQASRNLLISFFIAFVFLTLLIYTITPFYSLFSETATIIYGGIWSNFLVGFIPKLSGMIGLLTIFLYFIRLYKSNMTDTRYYQNEATNIDHKLIALKTAIFSQNEKVIDSLARQYAKTERNEKLTEAETTTDLERIKMDNDLNKNYLEQILAALNLNSIPPSKDGKS